MEECGISYRVVRTGIFEKEMFEWRSEGSESEPRKGKNVLSKDHPGTEVPKQEVSGLLMLKIQERGWSGRSRESRGSGEVSSGMKGVAVARICGLLQRKT